MNSSWGNPETEMVRWLSDRVSRVKVYTKTPASWDGNLPAVKVSRSGGSRLGLTRRVTFDLEIFASDRSTMWDVVSEVECVMRDLASNGTSRWYVDDVEETFSAAEIDYENAAVSRATATYTVALRPRV